MAVLATIHHQPSDIRDYDIDFGEWFPSDDSVTSTVISVAPVGLTVNYAIQTPRVKVWLRSGGVSGTTYKVTVKATTTQGRAKEVELKVKVKDE